MAQCHVLTMLALRMDWITGCGFASVRQLGQDADASERTVRRGLDWARDTGYLLRTRRGHRVTSERTVASEWRLTQPVTGDLLEKPTGQNGRPNRSMGPTQPVTTAPPSRTSSSRTSSSARRRASADGARAGAHPETPPLPPPCPYCGEQFITPGEFAALTDAERQEAYAGKWMCGKDECIEADFHCRQCGAELDSEPDNLCWACQEKAMSR